MEIINLPFEQLKISKMNERFREPPPDTGYIRPAIRAKGILQPLLVREEDGMFGIVFGRSRYYSAKEERDEGSTKFDTLPCVVMGEGDDADALEASIIENHNRRDPHPITQYENFVHLLKMKRTIEGIATTFGKTRAQVRQCLALGRLAPKIRDLFRDGQIEDDTAAALTLASLTQQREWLRQYDHGNAPEGEDVKDWLLGDTRIATSAALFPLKLYNGALVGDLFAKTDDGESIGVSYFCDLEQFWQLQNAAIAEKVEALKDEGWDDVIVLEAGKVFHPHSFVEAGKDMGGLAFISVTYDGVVEIHEGYITHREAAAVERAREEVRAAQGLRRDSEDGEDEGEEKPKLDVTRPTITQTMENYLGLHRHAVVRVALLQNPRTAFRLLVAHAAAASGNWSVHPDPQRARSDEVVASIKASPAQAAFTAERAEVEALSGITRKDNTESAFAKLLKLDDAAVMRVAVFVMADTLAAGSDAVDAVGETLAVDARTLWHPDAVFFDLLRDRAAINALLAEVGGKSIAKGNVTEKGKTQKAIIRDYLAGANGRAKVEGWLPGWMEFPRRDLGAKPKKVKPKADPAPLAIAAE